MLFWICFSTIFIRSKLICKQNNYSWIYYLSHSVFTFLYHILMIKCSFIATPQLNLNFSPSLRRDSRITNIKQQPFLSANVETAQRIYSLPVSSSRHSIHHKLSTKRSNDLDIIRIHRTRRHLLASTELPHSPPRILPDLPGIVRFFDRKGMHIRCQVSGNPAPKISWFSLSFPPSTGSGNSMVGIQSASYAASGESSPQTNKDIGISRANEILPESLSSQYVTDLTKYNRRSASATDASKHRIVVKDGWLNFTAVDSSTMRQVFYCQAKNYLGHARSRKMVVHQVPMLDENLRISYTTYPIKPGQKAVITCELEQSIFNRFLKVDHWKVYLNGTLNETIDHSFGRYSLINGSKHPELHIRSITEFELENLEVRCVLQSIVDEKVKVIGEDRQHLLRFQVKFPYTELRSSRVKLNVLRGATVELPWAVESETRIGVKWSYSPNHQAPFRFLLPPTVPVAGVEFEPTSITGTDNPVTTKPLMTMRYEILDDSYGNLRLYNVSLSDSGSYKVETVRSNRQLTIIHEVHVRAPLGVKLTPSERVVDFGTRVELRCEVTGHPRANVYWLHDASSIPLRHHVETVSGNNDSSKSGNSATEESTVNRISSIRFVQRLTIEKFSLDDVGIYQCFAENGYVASEHVNSQATRTKPDSGSAADGRSTNGTANTESDLRNYAATSIRSITSAGNDNYEFFDSAQATALLTMGKMRPQLTWQHPSVEKASTTAQVLMSLSGNNSDITLECRFAGFPKPNITWFRDDELIPLGMSQVVTPAVAPATGASYTIITRLVINLRKVNDLNKFWEFGGEYHATAKNDYGTADCRTFVLMETDLRLRPLTRSPPPAIAGDSYSLKCYFIGAAIPTLHWHRIKSDRDKQRIPVDHRHQLLENGRELRITDVNQEEDEADYCCTASHEGVIVNITMPLKVSHAPRLFKLPDTRQVKYTRDMLSYSCSLQNRADEPWYAWWQFQKVDTNHTEPLRPHSDVESNESVKNATAFFVSYMDEASSLSEDHNGRHLSEKLRAAVPTFVWQRPNAAVHVTVQELDKNLHHGNLTCVVMNEVGMDKESIRVTFVPELEFSLRPPNNKEVTVGETIAINCTAKPSDFEPIVQWKFFDKTVSGYVGVANLSNSTNGRISQLPNGTLLLSTVNESDPREFLCFLKPGKSSTAVERSSAVNLEVHVPARIEPVEDVEKVRGSRFNLTCSVHGDSADLRSAWYYRRSPDNRWYLIDKPCVGLNPEDPSSSSLSDCHSFGIEGKENRISLKQTRLYKPNKRGLDRQLQFDSVMDGHMGHYMCEASNAFNRDSAGRKTTVKALLRLTVISTPDAVTFVENSSRTTDKTIFFSWHPPVYNGNKPILKYRIRYRPPEPASVDDANLLPDKMERTVNANDTHIELTDLRPYTKYHVSVEAINVVGPSPERVQIITTQEAKPSGPVRRLLANGTASDTIAISWDNPAPEHLNGNVDRYWLCRQRVTDGAQSDQQLSLLPWPADNYLTEDQLTSTSMHGQNDEIVCAKITQQRDFEVTGLPKFTAYAFRVIALNSKGASPPAYAQARTLEDLPQGPPTDVTCSSQQHSITVSWNPPGPDTINGILTEYHVSYYTDNILGDETHTVHQAVEGQTTVTLAGLLAYTNYTIQVAVSNRKGRGPASPRLVCLTKEAPPAAPEFVKAKPVNDSCIVVSWLHPKKPQGRTRKYCIKAFPIYVNPSSNGHHFRSSLMSSDGNIAAAPKGLCVEPDFSMPYNFHYLCDLIEEQFYNISVQATNQFDGHQAWTEPVQVTANPPVGIISIGGKLSVQNKMPVAMDCLVINDRENRWSYPSDPMSGIHVLENGTLTIDRAELVHNGRYECSAVLDSISYDLTVQEIIEEPPRSPMWHKFTTSLRGIQAEWFSPGSSRVDSPILWFHLNWTNLYTGASEAVRLSADQRSYYLHNLTCATPVRFQLRAENKIGNSSLTTEAVQKTPGSYPLPPNTDQLLPYDLRGQTTVSFNLSSFLPGNGCAPLTYHLLIMQSEGNDFNSKPALVNRTLTRADLITLIKSNDRRRCCYNVSELNSGAHYRYEAVATNPAGSAKVSGHFWTLTADGRAPNVNRNHNRGQDSFFQRPSIVIPLASGVALFIIILIALPYIYRYRRLGQALCTNKDSSASRVTQCQNDLRGPNVASGNANNSNSRDLHEHQQLLRQHQYFPYHLTQHGAVRSNAEHQSGLTGNSQPDSQASTALFAGRRDGGNKGGGNRRFARSRMNATTYDRGHPDGQKSKPFKQDEYDRRMINNAATTANGAVDEDRLSIDSMDSQGNINPYATYAPTCRSDFLGSTSNNPISSNITGGGASNRISDNKDPATSMHTRPDQFRDAPYGRHPSAGFKRGFSVQPTMDSVTGHHYHYPNLDSAAGKTSVGRPRLLRVGSSGRLRLSPAFLMNHPHLIPSAVGRLPTQYDNSTLGGDDDEDEDIEDDLAHASARLGQPMTLRGAFNVAHEGGLRPRRVNSFDSLHRLPRGISRTYHRGFDVTGPYPIAFAPSCGPADRGLVHTADPSVAYRGSILSGTTLSSNHDELLQAYEYDRKHRLHRLATTGPIQPSHHHPTTVSVNYGNGHPTLVPQNTRMIVPGAGGEASNESGSSDATDSGIRQFTQQPPRPDAGGARQVDLEMPVMFNGDDDAPTFRTTAGVLQQGKFVPIISRVPGGRHPQPSNDRDCSSEMTDTYASVDYNGTPYGAVANAGGRGRGDISRQRYAHRPFYGQASAQSTGLGLLANSNRARQPLPALPSSSSIGFADADPPAYGTEGAYNIEPTTDRQARTGYYQPSGPQTGAAFARSSLPERRGQSIGGRPSTVRAADAYLTNSRGQPIDPKMTPSHLNASSHMRANPPRLTEYSGDTHRTTDPEENVYTSEFVLV